MTRLVALSLPGAELSRVSTLCIKVIKMSVTAVYVVSVIGDRALKFMELFHPSADGAPPLQNGWFLA